MESRTRKQIFVTIFVLLVALAPLPSVQAEDPWQILKGFTLIPDSPTLVEEHYAAALFVNSEKGLLAAVIFKVTCDSGSCDANHGAAYSVFNAQGLNIRRYVDPQDQELAELMSNGQIV